MVLAFFGYEIEESELALLLETDANGTLFENLTLIERLGFQVTLGPRTPADLRAVSRQGSPLITAVHTAQLPTFRCHRGGDTASSWREW